MRETTKVHAALAASALCFGTFPVAGKIALAELPPLAVALLRVAAAAAILQAVRRASTRERIFGGRALGRFLAASLLGVVLNQGLFLLGLARTSAIHTVLLVATIPPFAYGAGILAGRETFLWRKLGGIGLALAGVAALLAAREVAPRPGDQATLAGDALVTANSLCYAIYLVVSKPLTRRYEPITVVAWIFTFGAIAFAPIGGPSLARLAPAAVSARAWAALAWIVVFPTGCAYYLASWALRRADASTVAAYTFVQPVVTTSLAIPILGEVPGPPALAAAVAIFGGVALIARARA
jgi:drug/metabolite transporter (DMT)-like permease